MDIRAEKREIRKRILAIRDSLDSREREKASLLLTERILGHQWFYRADRLLCFISYGSEISTMDILQEAWKAGKKVYVPKVLPEQKMLPEQEKILPQTLSKKTLNQMEFYRITSMADLEPGYRGIPEPAGTTERYGYSGDIARRTLMLMPGVAFDGYRTRLGYGRGFYDRYLADKPELVLRTIAVGYRCQMVDKLPGEETDIRPCQVLCV